MPRLRTALLVSAALLVTGVPGLPGPSPASAATPTAGQSTYVPVSPVRVMETRPSQGVIGPQAGPVGPGGTVDLVVAGVNGVPAGATAVVLNVTVVQPTSGTDVRVYPTPADASFPTVSNLNAAVGVTVANLVTVKVGQGGAVRLRNEKGETHLLADLSGYYVEGGGGASYTGASPRRLVDTREGTGAVGPGEVRDLVVRGGEKGAPEAASAVVLNVTAVGGTEGTDVRVYPSGAASPPTVSNLNPPRGRTVPAAVVVAVGSNGAVSLRNEAGSVHLVVDLSGWYVPGTDGAVFHPVDPLRLLDQRETRSPLGAGGTADLVVGGGRLVHPTATAAVLNVTATGVSSSSDVRVYPSSQGGEVPTVSNLNVVRGQTVPNAVFATLGKDGSVRLRNESGTLSLIADVSGWFGPAGEGWDISWPQCRNTSGASDRNGTVAQHPTGGAFAVIGLTDGTGNNFRRVQCFDDAYAWASSLPGKPSVYVILDAPGSEDSDWQRPGPRDCDGTSGDPDCGWNYGWNLLSNALTFLPTDPDGSRPMVWLDVEGPYSSGPFWQTQAVNREVIRAAVTRLAQAGVRTGIYTDHATSSFPDWQAITGGTLAFPTLPVWLFPAPAASPQDFCEQRRSPSGGPVVMTQYQTQQDGVTYDTNHPC